MYVCSHYPLTIVTYNYSLKDNVILSYLIFQGITINDGHIQRRQKKMFGRRDKDKNIK